MTTQKTAYASNRPDILPALLFCFSFFCLHPAIAQEPTIAATHVTIAVKDKPFSEVLSVIESQVPFKFAYGTELVLRQKNVSVIANDISLPDLLTFLFRGTSLTYNLIGDQIILQNIAPSRITLSGYIKDSRTGELLIGASIYVPAVGAGISSNNYGFYSITVPAADTMALEISYVGYKKLIRKVNTHDNLTLSIDLEHDYKQEEINRFTIANDKREDNVKKNQSALIELSSDMIVAAPSVSGSGDLISSVEMLPGVQAGIDGTPGYCVRGGNTGQNLILLDEATLYNPSHQFGIVGIFNPPAIKHASLIKGGFPASYGGYLSSVLDVAMKDGSNQQFGGIVELGNIASSATLYGPLQSGRSSFLLSARRSTVDWWLQPTLNQNFFSNYYFYDVNAKLNFQLSRKDRLLLSFYNGRDNNTYSSDSNDTTGINYSMHFGNSAYTIRWNHQYSRKVFSNTSLIYNRYHQFLAVTQQDYLAQLYSGIRDMNVKTELTWYPSPAHTICAGADYLYQTLYPATLSEKIPPTDSTAGINPDAIPEKTATRVAAYASDAMKLGRRFQLYLGIRAPFYYKPNAQYLNIEPRLSLLYMLDPSTSLKVSYSDVHQYTHLVQSYNSSFPAEVWIGSSEIVRPQASHEVSAGIFKNFKENVFQTSLEFYYKGMDNQLLFKGGTTPTIDINLEDQLVFGKGWSYGAEFFVRKNRGKWTGWLAYSLAYAYQQFDSLNLGQSFPFAFDRRHTLDISTAYSPNKHWKFAANFFLASGRAFTLNTDSSPRTTPDGNPLYDDQNNNGAPGGSSTGVAPNNYRLTPYNRLDLSVHYKKSWNIGRKPVESEWVLSVYNVYARQNSSFAYRTIDLATKQVIAREVSFLPVIPSITYSLKF